MPPLIGAVVAAGATAAGFGGATVFGSLTVGNLLGAVASTAASFGLQQLLQPKQRKQFRSDRVVIKDSDPRRLVIVGRYKVGGKVFVAYSWLGYALYLGVVHCEGPVSGIKEYWVNDVKTWIPEYALVSPVAVPPWQAAVIYEGHLGAVDQEASPILLTAVPGWTADHRLRGLCYTVQWCVQPPNPQKYFQLVFPDGVPALRAVIDGVFVTDIRTDTRVWSQNPALHIREYMVRERHDAETGKTWRFADPDDIDDDSFAAFADLCDQPVPLAAGGTEPRYWIGGAYDLDEEPREVLGRMCAACDAELIITDEGKIGIVGGQWEEPDITITEGMILGTYTYEMGVDSMSAVNQINWKFCDPKNHYQRVDGDPWDDIADQNDRGFVLPASDTFDFVQSHPLGRRLAKIKAGRLNPKHILRDMTVKLSPLALRGRRVVRVRIADLGLNEAFSIEHCEPSGDVATVSLELSSLDPAMYGWDPEAEEGTPPAHPSVAVPGTPPEAQLVTLTLVRRAISPGIWAVRIRVTAQDEPGWTLEVRYREDGGGDGDWRDMAADGVAAEITPDLSDGTTYEVQARWIGHGVGEWSPIQSILATADVTPPDAPEGLVADGGSGQVALAWTAPGSPNVYRTRLYRAAGATTPFESATMIRAVNLSPNQPYAMVDAPLDADTYRYWVTATNGSGVEGDPDGPVNATVT